MSYYIAAMNIQRILTELNFKMSDKKIGDIIGAPQSIVTRLRHGIHKQTYYARAEAIKKLALENGIDVHELDKSQTINISEQ